jgi:hypothetical protein
MSLTMWSAVGHAAALAALLFVGLIVAGLV